MSEKIEIPVALRGVVAKAMVEFLGSRRDDHIEALIAVSEDTAANTIRGRIRELTDLIELLEGNND